MSTSIDIPLYIPLEERARIYLANRRDFITIAFNARNKIKEKKLAAYNSHNVTLVAKWNEARDLQLADRPRFHNLFATRLDPPCSAQHLLRPPSPQSFIFQNFGTRLQKRNRRPVRNASWHRAPGLRNGDENMRNNRVGDYVLRQHCAKDREKGSPAMQSILLRFDVASFARCEFVTCYEFRARHTNVMPRNIVIGDAYTSVSCRLLVLRRRIIRITALVHECEISTDRVSPAKRISPSDCLINSS